MNQLAKIRDLTIGATGEGYLVEITDNHCFIKLIDALRERLHVSQAKPKMSSKEIVQSFIITSKYHDEIGDQCVCGQKNIKFIYLCRNILGGELFIVGDKCKDHWAKEDENIEVKCKSLERKLKREKFIREGIPHCSNCVRDTTNNRCLQCVDIIKYKKARLRIKRFIIKNIKNIKKSLIRAFKGKIINFKLKTRVSLEKFRQELEKAKTEWKKKYKIKYENYVWILKPK